MARKRSVDNYIHSSGQSLIFNQLDLSSIFNRTSLEIIGRAGIGYSFDLMAPGEAPHDKYANTIKELLCGAIRALNESTYPDQNL
jgi:hypothetical protein